MKLATKLTWMMLAVLLLVGSSIGYFGYRAAYRQVDEAAGIELVGCANITTGLVDPALISALAAGDTSKRKEIEDRIGWIVEHKPIFKEAFILSMDGKILAADASFQKRGYTAGQDFYFSEQDKKMIVEHKHSAYSKVYTYDGVSLKTGYGPIYQDHDPSKPIIALMAINFDGPLIKERTQDIILRPFIIGAIILGIAILAAYLMIRRMVSPLSKLSVSVNRVAHGDLSHEPVVLRGRDEIGRLAENFNEMTRNLHRLITEVNETSLQVASSSEQLSASAGATNQVGEHTVGITMEMAEGAQRQLHKLEDGYSSVRSMSEFIAHISETAGQALEYAEHNAEQARAGRNAVETAAAQLRTMQETTADLAERITDLSGHSREIEGMVEMISGIAEETHLLSLNAAIEAARAGEEGRGFAVVAESVRKLAERSAGSAAQIRERVGLIVGQMEAASELMAQSAKETEQGAEKVADARQSFSEIENSVSGMADQSRRISETVRRLSESSERLVGALHEIVAFANKTAEGAENMSASSQEQLAAMQEIEASAAFLSSLAGNLQTLIERFKV